MKTKLLLALAAAFCALATANAQPDRRRVVDSPITQKYQESVSRGFLEEMNAAISRGYHGFVDAGYTFGFGDYRIGRFEASTTHGYQFNPYLYAGVGVALHAISDYSRRYEPHHYYRQSQVEVPFYANIRATLLNDDISPLLDGRIGHYVTNSGGLYASVAVGCRFATWGRQAVNIYVGYSYEKLQFECLETDHLNAKSKLDTHGITLRVGYEF